VRTGIMRVYGSHLRRLLGHSLASAPLAFGTGIGVTALVQSSNAVHETPGIGDLVTPCWRACCKPCARTDRSPPRQSATRLGRERDAAAALGSTRLPMRPATPGNQA